MNNTTLEHLKVILERRKEEKPSTDAICELLIYHVREIMLQNSYIENVKSLGETKEDLFNYLNEQNEWNEVVDEIVKEYYPDEDEDEFFKEFKGDLLTIYTMVTHSHRVKRK